jgi:hypothetical protein
VRELGYNYDGGLISGDKWPEDLIRWLRRYPFDVCVMEACDHLWAVHPVDYKHLGFIHRGA